MNNDLNDNNIENKLNDSKELLIFLKDELKSQKKDQILKAIYTVVFITSMLFTLSLVFKFFVGQLNGLGNIELVVYSFNTIIMLLAKNSIDTSNIPELKKQISNLENTIVPDLENKLQEARSKTKSLETSTQEVMESKRTEVTMNNDYSLNDNYKESKGKARSLRLVPKNDDKRC